MSGTQTFWAVECGEGDPDFFVCMNCLDDVYRRKVPMECSSCGATSAFEAFTFDSIQDWGTAELITKAKNACSDGPSLTRAAVPGPIAQSFPESAPFDTQ